VKEGGKSKKWRLWRSSSGDVGSWKAFKGNHHKAASEGSDSPPVVAPDAYTAAVATVVRAPPKDFRLVKQEWAAIRIQTAFRAFLVWIFILIIEMCGSSMKWKRFGVDSCVVMIVGKKGFEGIERSGEDSSSCSGETGEETSCGDTEVYASLGSGSGPC